jgi:orotate phosphoribosyltransferase
MYIDTGSKKLRRAHTAYFMNRQAALKQTFNKSNVDHVSIATNEDYVKSLMQLFAMRG